MFPSKRDSKLGGVEEATNYSTVISFKLLQLAPPDRPEAKKYI